MRMTKSVSENSPLRLLSRRHNRSALSVALVSGVGFAVVGLSVGLTPGTSVGVLSTPVVTAAPFIVPPSSPTTPAPTAPPPTSAPASIRQAAASPATTTLGASTTNVPRSRSAAGLTTTTAPPTSRVPGKGSIRAIAGSARQGSDVALEVGGFRPSESVTFTIGSRKISTKSDSLGRATFIYSVPRTATRIVVKVQSPSANRTFTLAVRRR